MRRKTVKIFGPILLIAQLSLTLADFTHTEILAIGGLPDAIENHECGSKELHKPLDSCQPCLPCSRNIHLAALPETVSFNTPITQTPLSNPACSRRFDLSTTFSFPKRGPPAPAVL